MVVFRVFMVFLFSLLCGCAYNQGIQRVAMLYEFSQNRENIEDYLKNRQDNFNRLDSDLKNDSLKAGTKKEKVLSLYGDAVFCRNELQNHPCGALCLFSGPFKSLSGEAVFLYFDREEKLCFWKNAAQN